MGVRVGPLLLVLLSLATMLVASGWIPCRIACRSRYARPTAFSLPLRWVHAARDEGVQEVLVCCETMLGSPEIKELLRRRAALAVSKESTDFVQAKFNCLWTAHRGPIQLESTELELHFLGRHQLPTIETVDLWEKKLARLLQAGEEREPVLACGGSYHRELNTAYDAVHRASYISRSLQRVLLAQGNAVSKDDKSPVTVADFVVQALVLSDLARVFPEDRFIAEEDSEQLKQNPGIREGVIAALRMATGREWTAEEVYRAVDLGRFNGTAERVWVLDPVDGTKGFMRGEHFCIALALLVDGKPVLSTLGCPNLSLKRALESSPDSIPMIEKPIDTGAHVVYPLDSGSVYFAVSGQGAYARSLSMDAGAATEVQVSFKSDAREAVVCEAAESSHGNRGVTAALSHNLGFANNFIRIDGQCKYCLVGMGAADANLRLPPMGYVEKIWDHAAGSHFVAEAGGRVTDLTGSPLDFGQGRCLPSTVQGILSSNGLLHRAFVEALRKLYEEGVRSGTIKSGRYMDSS